VKVICSCGSDRVNGQEFRAQRGRLHVVVGVRWQCHKCGSHYDKGRCPPMDPQTNIWARVARERAGRAA